MIERVGYYSLVGLFMPADEPARLCFAFASSLLVTDNANGMVLLHNGGDSLLPLAPAPEPSP